jgi:peptidoglycan/LPS O-acetylase OafA/YrhL
MSSFTRESAPALWQPRQHITQLDGVRGLAILSVTLYRFSKEIPTDSWLGQALHTTFALGDRGVDLFFVLSGFLITGILVDARGSRNYFRNFLVRRSLRIFPVYFVALFCFLIAARWIPAYRDLFQLADRHQFYLWTYLTNIKMSLDGSWCFGYLDHFWSLAVEEHFYFVWPVVLFLFVPGRALKLALVLAVTCSLSRIAFAGISDNGLAPDVLTLFRCDALLIGAMLALQIRSPQGLAPLRPWVWPVFISCLILGGGAAILDKRLLTIGHTVWPLLWGSMLVGLLTGSDRSWLAHSLNFRWLQKLGTLSYAMYVFQSPLIPIVGLTCSVPILTEQIGHEIVANLLYMGIMFGLTYAAALLSWYGLEQHCLKLKKWFPTSGVETQPVQATIAATPALQLYRTR